MKSPSKTEAELRDEANPSPKTIEELNEYIQSLLEIPQTYGTCPYAMSLAAMAAFNFVASEFGVTGFQASCADLDFIKRTRMIKGPFMLLTFKDEIYEQGRTLRKFHEARSEAMPWIALEAVKNLRMNCSMHPKVFRNMLTLADTVLGMTPTGKEHEAPPTKEEIETWSEKLNFLELHKVASQSTGYPSVEFVIEHQDKYKRFGFDTIWTEQTDVSFYDQAKLGGSFRLGKVTSIEFTTELNNGIKILWMYDTEEKNSNGTNKLNIKFNELKEMAKSAKENVASVIWEYIATVSGQS